MTDDREQWYRTPRSAEECVAHKLADGDLLSAHEGGKRWEPCCRTAAQLAHADPRNFRLVYRTPAGMSPVIGSPDHAVGEARHLPEGMEAAAVQGAKERIWWDADQTEGLFTPDCWIEARPPAPPRTEMVPLTKLVGRTLVGETEAVALVSSVGSGWVWCDTLGMFSIHHIPVDPDTGMVTVLAEGEA